jgi:hypothetical protein
MEIPRQSIESINVKKYLNNQPLYQLNSLYDNLANDLTSHVDNWFRQKANDNSLYLLGTIIYLPKELQSQVIMNLCNFDAKQNKYTEKYIKKMEKIVTDDPLKGLIFVKNLDPCSKILAGLAYPQFYNYFLKPKHNWFIEFCQEPEKAYQKWIKEKNIGLYLEDIATIHTIFVKHNEYVRKSTWQSIEIDHKQLQSLNLIQRENLYA